MNNPQISVFIQPVEVDGAYRVSIVTIMSGTQQSVPDVQVMIGPGGAFNTIDEAYAHIKAVAPLITELVKGGLEMSKGQRS